MAFTTTYIDIGYAAAVDALAIIQSVDQFEPETQAAYFTSFLRATGAWGGSMLDGVRATGMVVESPHPTFVIGDRGEVCTVRAGQIAARDRLPDSGLEGRHLGQPNEIRRIAGRLYVCGFAGQIYTQDAKGTWVHMDDGVAEPLGAVDSIGLQSIDGTAANDLYTVGSGGLVFHWDGKAWTQIPVQTNVYLMRVRCFAPDHIVAVGQQGVVVEGDGKSSWRTSRIFGAEDLTLNDVALFQGKLYVGAENRLYVKKGKAWQEVKTGLPPKKTQFLRLMVGGDRLWAMGFKRVNSFDGQSWTAHPDPNNL